MAHNQQVNFDSIDGTGNVSTTFTVAAGSNRILAIGISHEQGANGRQMSTLSVGGEAATRRGHYNRGASGAFAYVEWWWLTESQVAALSANPTITVTNSNGGNVVYGGTIFQLNDADQTGSLWNEAQVSGDTTAAIETSLSTATNAMVAAIVSCTSPSASFTQGTALTEVTSSDRGVNSAFRSQASLATASGPTILIGGDINSSSTSTWQIIYAISIPVFNANATISDAAPTGTVAGQTQFTWSATTNTASGTAYMIANTDQSKVTGATGAQIAAGHGNDDLAATLTDSVAVSTTSISKTKTGASAGTTYYYAIVQVTGGSNYSNVLYGSFTTATATRALQSGFVLYSAPNVPLASTAVVCWTKNTRTGAAVDGGTDGIAATTSASGEITTLTGLTIAAGDRFLQIGLPGGDTSSDHVYPASFVAES